MSSRRKQALRDELLAALAASLATARDAHAAAVEGATHGEARAENDKDTRGLEQSYLARGQAQRVEQHFLVAPQGGGITLSGGVQVVTPRSPLGRALLKARAGDTVEVQRPGGVRELALRTVE